MLATILAILGKIWPFILLVVGGIFWLINSWQKGKIKGQKQTIEELKNAEEVYKVKEDINKYDEQIRDKTDKQINQFEDQVQQAPTEEGKGEIVGDALDDYFGSKENKNEE
jgi:hypothetical protein